MWGEAWLGVVRCGVAPGGVRLDGAALLTATADLAKLALPKTLETLSTKDGS